MLFFATQLEKRLAYRGGIASIYNWTNCEKALSKGLMFSMKKLSIQFTWHLNWKNHF